MPDESSLSVLDNFSRYLLNLSGVLPLNTLEFFPFLGELSQAGKPPNIIFLPAYVAIPSAPLQRPA